MAEESVAAQFGRLLAEHPDDIRIYSAGDEMNVDNMETHGPFQNGDPQIIGVVQTALAAQLQTAVVSAGPSKVLLMTAKQGTTLFDGPPGTKQEPYKLLITQGHAALMEGTQAKLNGNHAKGRSLYQSALAAFQQAEQMRPNEASPKLGIAEASSKMWDTEDPRAVMTKVQAAEQLLLQGLSEGRINKFDGKDVVQFEYAMCNLAMKQRDAAKENLRQVLVINPEHRFARGILESVEEQDSKKGGCFIATAAYGSALAPEVQVLRTFRDEVLRKSTFGRGFVGLYGTLSPPFAKLISRSDFLRRIARLALIEPFCVKSRREISADRYPYEILPGEHIGRSGDRPHEVRLRWPLPIPPLRRLTWHHWARTTSTPT